ASTATVVSQLIDRRPPMRIAFNGAMFAIAAAAGGLAIDSFSDDTVGGLLLQVAICAFVYNWVVNLLLVSAVLSLSSRRPYFKLVWTNVRQTTAPFALMASASLMLVVLWQRSPALSIALVGPLIAIGLYQRSTFKAMRAMRLALTDPLTGL